MSGRYSISILGILLVLLVALPSVSEPATGTGKQGDGTAGRPEELPVEITAERLTADNRTHTAVFEGTVVAKQGDVTLYADWMKVFYSDSGDVSKIEAKGNVRLTRGGREISSEEAVYYRKEQTVVFTGNPVAKEGNSMISGSRMIYYLGDDRSVVENSRVIIKRRNGP
ncbi:MAG: lipopolysaccharide transport periplasmic protein LptA [Nitrospirae bacterium]|nr:lipopolysaccharide transport periplasmic protein LptA [Nitrospirota bacterium]